MSELTKQFQITLYEKEILITTPTNSKEAHQSVINYNEGKRMLLLDKYGMQHDWLETGERELSYYECCGVLILFGIEPPSFKELCKHLEIDVKYSLPSSEETLMGHFKADAS